MKILLAGSRRASSDDLAYAERAVERAKDGQHSIIVGDNPKGIDAHVVRACQSLDVPFKVYGIADTSRNDLVSLSVYTQVPIGNEKFIAESYHKRDCRMIELCDLALFIWNGELTSKGTIGGFDYAVSSGKSAYLYRGDRLIKRSDARTCGDCGNYIEINLTIHEDELSNHVCKSCISIASSNASYWGAYDQD